MSSQLPQTLTALVEMLRSGSLSLHTYLDQLENLFARREPQVQAFVPEPERFERLHRQAAALLAQYPEPENRPPLFGVPVGVKDIFHVSGLVTRAGSKLPEEQLQGNEAQAVSALRSAGALILGKTVTTEFAYFAPGPTRNPQALDHTPGGSSSGSAAAVASGLSPLTLGTQTIGSVNRPAAFCGVVGYKPSYERISRQGVIPLSPSADHVGLFVPRVSDVAIAAALLCRKWETRKMAQRPVLGIPDGPFLKNASLEGQDHFAALCEHLAKEGFELKHVATMADFNEIVARHQLIVAAEAAQVHEAWFDKYGDLYHEKTVKLIESGQKISVESLETARQGQMQLRQELDALMDENNIDLWISPPAVGPAPLGLSGTGDPIMNLPWTHAGLPTLSIPAGKNNSGLPLGLQVIARWLADEKMIAWSSQIENIVSP